MKYKSATEMKQAHQKMVHQFPIEFAFGQDQFYAMMKDWNLSNGDDGKPTEDDISNIVSIGACGFILKKDAAAYLEMMRTITNEEKEFRASRKNLTEEIYLAMQNVEYAINPQADFDVCRELGRTEEALKDPFFASCFKKALKKYNAAT